MKRIVVMLCACALLCAGCAAIPETPAESHTEDAQAMPEAVTLFDTSTVKIVMDGTETAVTDKATGTEYSYTTTKKLTSQQPTLEQLQARCIARTSTDTDTLKIELVGGIIVVSDKCTGQIYYIDR